MKYPTHRIYAILDHSEEASQAIAELLASGISRADIDIYHGSKGLDGVGQKKLLSEELGETSNEFPMGDVEDESFHIYQSALDKGEYVLAVLAESEETKNSIGDILTKNSAHSLNYYGTWTVDAL